MQSFSEGPEAGASWGVPKLSPDHDERRVTEILEALLAEVRVLTAAARILVERELSRVGDTPRGFSPTARETWPEVLTADEVAAIFRRSVNGLKNACKLGHFYPPPFKVQPYRWSRADVLHHLEAGTKATRGPVEGTPRRRASGPRLVRKNP